MEEETVKKPNKIENFVNASLSSILFVILSLLLIVSILAFIWGFGAKGILNQKIEDARIAAIPVEIQLAVIDCNGCIKTGSTLDSVLRQNVNITRQENLSYYDSRAQELIAQYQINKLPAILIFGDIENNKSNFDKFERISDALVSTNMGYPYLDLQTDSLVGVVKVIEIKDSSCVRCTSMEQIPVALAQSGVSLGDWKKVEYNSVEGRQLASQYSLSQIPSLLVSKEIDYYETASQTLRQAGASDKGEYYIIHSTLPPYHNLISNKIVGLTDLIMIYDKSCSECYDVTLNKQILARFGVVINTEKTLDVSSPEAKQLISKYSIEKVPMFLLSPEAKDYQSLVSVWSQVGTIENDGWFVMRRPEVLGNTTGVGG